MKRPIAFPEMLNRVFTDLRSFGEILISYEYIDNQDKTPSVCCRVTAVNNCPSLTTFTYELTGILDNLIVSLNGAMDEICIRKRACFLKQALRRCRILITLTTPAGMGHTGQAGGGRPLSSRQFVRPRFTCTGTTLHRIKEERAGLLCLTVRYASVWHALVTGLAEQIETMASICRFNPAILPRPKSVTTEEKLLFNGTREELGSFLKYLSELGIINCTNTSMVARVGSMCFRTHRQAVISPEGMRNQINASGPLEIENLHTRFCKSMQNYREKLGAKKLTNLLSIQR